MTQKAAGIENEDQYRAAVRHLDQNDKPPLLLRLLMNALESYRQTRKMGWSRPQNKYGLTVFRSFRLDRERDQSLIDQAFETLLGEFAELDEASSRYVQALREDPRLMGFIFVHDCLDEGKTYEGITLSFGRVSSDKPHHRDRLDLILESKVTGGSSRGLSRVRAYVDPFKTPIKQNPADVFLHEPPRHSKAQELFLGASQRYASWQDEPDKAWQHWTQRYINYFGPRTEPVEDSYFPTAIDAPTSPRIDIRKVA